MLFEPTDPRLAAPATGSVARASLILRSSASRSGQRGGFDDAGVWAEALCAMAVLAAAPGTPTFHREALSHRPRQPMSC